MKKSPLILLLIIISFGIEAQEENVANQFILGGSLSFLTQKNAYPLSILNVNLGSGGFFSNNLNDSKNTIFRINPYVGKELNAHWILGLQLGLSTQNYRVEDALFFGPSGPVDFSRKSYQVALGIFARYIVNPVQRFNFFLQPSIQNNFFRENTAYDGEVTEKEKASFIEVGIGVGMLYKINDRFRVTLRSGGLNYINGKWEILDTDISRKFSSFGGNLNLSNLSFGVEVRL